MHFWKKIRQHPLKTGLIVASLLILILVIFAHQAAAPKSEAAGSSVNLLTGRDWSHYAGASQTANGVRVTGLSRAIVNQDGSPNQANPPVNVRGPHLSIKGDFAVQANMGQIPKNGSASIYFYGQVPIIYDEWRYQAPQMQLEISQNTLKLSVWNGTGDSASEQKQWTISSSSSTTVKTEVINNRLNIWLNDKYIGSASADNVFSSNQVWFGTDASVGQSWLLSGLTAQPLGKGSLQVNAAPALKVNATTSDSLRQLAKANARQIPIGVAVTSYALFSDPGYRQIVGSQFSMLTPENELKAQFTEPQPNVYSFADADNLVDFALANGMSVHGHNLVFSEANPQWMQSAAVSQRQKIMTDHIKTEVSHYKGRINEWDVVDEPLNDNNDNNGDSSDLRQNIWYQAMGENYIDTAFNAAHAANPNAKLYLNEYGLEADGSRWDEFLALVQRLQSRNVPINGVGFQAHVYEPGDEIDEATLAKHMQTLANMGLLTRISEMDAYGDNPQHQAQQYSNALQACLESSNCTSFNIWGITDRYGSTTEYHAYPLQLGNDLPWDSNLQPKLTYQSLQNTLKK